MSERERAIGAQGAHEEQVARVYRLLGAGERLWRDELEGGHVWSGRPAYVFTARYLGPPAASVSA